MKSWARLGQLRWLRAVCILAVFWVSVQFILGRGFFDQPRTIRSDPHIPFEYDGLGGTVSPDNLCRHHGWRLFQPQDGVARKIYDLIMVNNELDWLEIRLNSTYDHVDYFVIVEASQTFTGHPKPLTIKDNYDMFKPYHAKMIYHLLEYPPDFSPQRTWDREDLQRDSTYTQVFPRLTGAQAPTKGDVMVVADVDEIPRPETLRVLRTCDFPRRLTLRSRFYYYGFQFRHRGPEWAHPQATTFQGFGKTILPGNLRTGDGGLPPLIYWDKADLWNAAWHCSSCFRTMGELLDKMGAFSHTWMNRKEFRNRYRIADRIRNGKDLWDRSGQVYDLVENNKDVPPVLLKEPERFGYLLDRTGQNAGFVDYPA